MAPVAWVPGPVLFLLSEKFINLKKLYHLVIAAAWRGRVKRHAPPVVKRHIPPGRGGTRHPFPRAARGEREGATVLMAPFRFTNAYVRRYVRTMLGKTLVTC